MDSRLSEGQILNLMYLQSCGLNLKGIWEMMREHEHSVKYYQYYEIGEMTKKQVVDDDRRTQEAIKEAEQLISWLRSHRLELAKRYRGLETMESHVRVSLKRQVNYSGKKIYRLETERVFSDGTEESIDLMVYPGTERHKAIKAFNDLKKSLPHQEYILDIEKSKWER